MSLTGSDQAKLKKILQLAHGLERDWPTSHAARQHPLRLTDNADYITLKAEISACAEAESPNLRRLANTAQHLHDEVSLSHFYAFLVPFERLSNRALRDDEFVVLEGDKTQLARDRLPLKLIVENLRSAFNVGALFRTCECLGVSEILLCGYTPDPATDNKTARTSMGTDSQVKWRRFDRTTQACEALQEEGYTIVALETTQSATSLHEIQFRGPTALLIGNERFGLEGDTLRAADTICRIPLRGSKNSLNVGIAFGITAFEWLRQHDLAGDR